jgi:hypothetical protein
MSDRQERDARQPEEARDERDTRGPEDERDPRDERRPGDPRDPRDAARLGEPPDAAEMAVTAKAMRAPSKARKAMALALAAGLAFGAVVGVGVIRNRGDIIHLEDVAESACGAVNEAKDAVNDVLMTLIPNPSILRPEQQQRLQSAYELLKHEKC